MYTRIKSWYLRVKDNWLFALIFFLLTLILPKLFEKINIGGIFIILSYKIPVWSFILSIFLTLITRAVYRYIKNKGNLEILKATYGRGSIEKDIAHELKKSIIGNNLKIVLSNNIAGDPVPGVVKVAKIEYKMGNRKIKKEFIEGDVINLP